MIERLTSLGNRGGACRGQPQTLAPVDVDDHARDEASSVRNVMPREVGSDPIVGDVERRLELLSVMELSLQKRVTEAVNSELERTFNRPANELRAEPALAVQISHREGEILSYMKAEINAERELISLYL